MNIEYKSFNAQNSIETRQTIKNCAPHYEATLYVVDTSIKLDHATLLALRNHLNTLPL